MIVTVGDNSNGSYGEGAYSKLTFFLNLYLCLLGLSRIRGPMSILRESNFLVFSVSDSVVTLYKQMQEDLKQSV